MDILIGGIKVIKFVKFIVNKEERLNFVMGIFVFIDFYLFKINLKDLVYNLNYL